jgi:hypothetical protein
MKKKVLILLGVLAIAIGIWVAIALNRPQDSRAAWISVLGKCASTELIGKDVLYFGASNEIGPGSIWRKTDQGEIRLRLELADIEPDKGKRDSMIHTNNTVTCQGNTDSGWQLQLGLPFEGAVTPVSGDVRADLKKAESVKVNVGGWSIDELKEALFERMIRDNESLRDEFESPDRVVVENAVKVSGFSADFKFSKSLADQLKAKYSGKEVSLQNGARLASQFTADTTLTMSSSNAFYILAAFGRMNRRPGGVVFASAKETPRLLDERPAAVMDMQIRTAAARSIQQAVQKKTPNASFLMPSISVTQGVVTLKGPVEDRALRMIIDHAAEQTSGVRKVEDRMEARTTGG